jgi:hypothetical protein
MNIKRTWEWTAMLRWRSTVAIVAVFVALLAGCASQVVAPPALGKREPAEFPGAYYRALRAQGNPVFGVDPTRSIVVIEVRRGGSLARFGHDHAVASRDLAGIVAPDARRADLWVPLDTLTVDEPALRAEAGFETQPSPEDIAGTRSNMLGRVLEIDRYPYALIAVSALGSTGNSIRLRMAITLHGTTRCFETSADVDSTKDELSVSGAIAIDQSEFGIVPLSVLGGAIAVQDRLTVSYRIRARRME